MRGLEGASEFRPFYERIADRIVTPFVGRLVVALALGLAFHGARFASVGYPLTRVKYGLVFCGNLVATAQALHEFVEVVEGK